MSTELSNVENPFGKGVVAATNNAMAAAESDRAIQEVQAALIIAKKFPRDQIRAMDRIINSCTRPTLAQTALYSYPRGGQEITGPSIRLAEAMAQEWGNMQFGIRELSSENGMSTVEAFAWDVETNTRQVKVFQVPHARFAGGQLKKLTDPRDIYEMVANQGARRLRACILGVIPGDVTEAAIRQCEVTQQNNVDVTPDVIKTMLAAFEAEYKVTQQMIEKRIGKRAEAIAATQLLNLRKIFQSLRDGMSKPSDWFDIAEEENLVGPKASDLNADLQAKKSAKGTSSAARVETPTETKEPDPAQVEAKFADVTNALKTATTLSDLDEAATWIAAVPNSVHREQLNALYDERRAALSI